MKIISVFSINRYTLAVYYTSYDCYKYSIIDDYGVVYEPDDIFYSSDYITFNYNNKQQQQQVLFFLLSKFTITQKTFSTISFWSKINHIMLTLQEGIDPHTDKTIWVMLDEDYQVVEPIQRYLTYLCASKSPNTVKAYGGDLIQWWEFLDYKCLDWRNVNLYQDLEDFAYWLQVGTRKIISLKPVESDRVEKTINRKITAVSTFYDYHLGNQTVDFSQFKRFNVVYKTGNKSVGNKGYLKGIAKARPTREKLVKLKEPRKFPGCLTDKQVEVLVDACDNLRDKLMILMLNCTGMRKGALCGLKHEDIGEDRDHFIKVVKRKNNPNKALVKTLERTIPVTKELLQLYDKYLMEEYPDTNSEYVFVNIWRGNIGAPIMLSLPNKILKKKEEKTGIRVYPHLFRHTYATRLLKAGYALGC